MIRALFLLAAMPLTAGDFPRALEAFRGSTATLDGAIAPGEYDDASFLTGVRDWVPQFSPTTDPSDLSLN